jgi:hypothetical protein
MIKSAVEKQENFQRSVKAKLDSIAARFKELRGELKELNKGLGIVALDLRSLVSNFPLILGILIAFSITLTAYRSRELRWVVERLDLDGRESTLREYLLPRNFLSIGADQTKSKSTFSSTTGTAILCAIAWLWIGASVYQLRELTEISGFRLTTTALSGFVLVGLACVYRRKSEKDFL